MTVVPIAARAVAGRAAAGKAAVRSKASAKIVDSTAIGGTVSTRLPKVPSAPRAPRGPGGETKYGIKIEAPLPGATGRPGGRSALAKATDGLGGAYRRVLVAEFLVCVTILAFSPMTAKHSGDTPVAFMKRGAATCALFFVLGLISAGGRGAGKVAAGFGGVVTLALLLSSRDVFAVLAQRFNGIAASDAGDDGVSPDGNLDVTDASGTLPDGSTATLPSNISGFVGLNPAGVSNGVRGGGIGPDGGPLL